MLTSTLNIDNSRSVPTMRANLIRTHHEPDSAMEFNSHIADLMLAIRAGRPTVATRSSTRTKLGQQIASFAWKNESGRWDRFHLDRDQYYYQPFEPGTEVAALDTQERWCDLVDKLLTAITYNCFITARTIDGRAVLSWDRASHGNTPTIVLHADDTIESFYQWPEYLPEHLEPKATPPVLAHCFYDHHKPLHLPHVTRTSEPTGETYLDPRWPTLPPCLVTLCPNRASYNAPLPRGDSFQRPVCNHHLYGPAGYTATRQPYQTLSAWLGTVNQQLDSLTPMELFAAQQRASKWVHIN